MEKKLNEFAFYFFFFLIDLFLEREEASEHKQAEG